MVFNTGSGREPVAHGLMVVVVVVDLIPLKVLVVDEEISDKKN